MIRFLHAADLHLDSPLVGLAAHADAPVARLRAVTRRAMEKVRREREAVQDERVESRRYYHSLANRRDQIKKEIKRHKPALLEGSPIAAKYLAGAYDAINRLEAEMDVILEKGDL